MNYMKHYFQLMANVSDRIYDSSIHDLHHIIPVMVGGPDHLLNIACLTKKEHILAHKLLRKFMPSRSHHSPIIKEGESRVNALYKLKMGQKQAIAIAMSKMKNHQKSPLCHLLNA